MNPAGKLISLVYALLLLARAAAAGFDTFGFAFVIGDGGGQPGVMMSAFLIATLVGLGLAIAALLSWTRSRAVSLSPAELYRRPARISPLRLGQRSCLLA